MEAHRVAFDKNGKADALKFLSALAALGKLTPGKCTDPEHAKSHLSTLSGTLTRLHHTLPPSRSPRKALSTTGLPGVRGSMSRERSLSMAAAPRFSIPRERSTGSVSVSNGHSYSPTTSAPLPMRVGGASPPGSPKERRSVPRKSVGGTFPAHFRWSIDLDIAVPASLTNAAAEAAICTFVNELRDLAAASEPAALSNSSSATASPTITFTLLGKNKSPRMNSRPMKRNKELARQLQQCFTLVAQLVDNNGLQWDRLFRAHCALTQQRMRREDVDAVLHFIKTDIGEQPLDAVTCRLAQSLVRFLQSHQMDVDSALVGLELNETWRQNFRFPPLADTDSSTPHSTGGTLAARMASAQARPLDFRALSERVLTISQLSSGDDVRREVVTLARLLKREELRTVSVGSIVVAHYAAGGRDAVTYCRLRSWKGSDHVLVYTGRAEIVVPCLQCMPIQASMMSLLEQGRIEPLVVDHASAVRLRLERAARAVCNELLLRSNVGSDSRRARVVAALSDANRDGLRLTDLRLIRAFAEHLSHVAPETEPYFAQCAVVYETYINSIDINSFTPVDRDEAITALLGLRMLYPTVLAETYEKLQSDLRMAEELLAEQVEEILSGARKEKMSTSWHTDVRMAVSLALERRGYDASAAPHDYISQPPASLPAIRSNLAILQTLINNQDDSGELAQIASVLRAIVYPVCERFIDDALSVVADQLQFRLSSESDALAQVQAQLEGCQHGDVARFRSVVADCEYLRTMRRLEENLSEHNPHIVPVSGLIMSSLVRKEKECLTILEVWDRDGGDGDLLTSSDLALSSTPTVFKLDGST